MKRIIALVICVLLVISVLVACQTEETLPVAEEDAEINEQAVDEATETSAVEENEVEEESKKETPNAEFEKLCDLITQNGEAQYNESDINNTDEVEFYTWNLVDVDLEEYKTAFYDGVIFLLQYNPKDNTVKYTRSWHFDGAPQIYNFCTLTFDGTSNCDFDRLEIYSFDSDSTIYYDAMNPGDYYTTASIEDINMAAYEGYGDDLPAEISDYYETEGVKEFYKERYASSEVEGNYLSFIRDEIYLDCRHAISEFVEILNQKGIDYESFGFSSGSKMI